MTLPDVTAFERAGLDAWPGIEVDWDGHWVRRSANGYTKRANSAQCFDPADDDDVEVRIARAVDWLGARGLPPVFRMTPLAGPALHRRLDALGWERIDHSHLFAMRIAGFRPDERVRTYAPLDPDFLAIARRLQDYSASQMAGLESLLTALRVPARATVLFADGVPVASAIHAVADGMVITGNVVTAADQRRKGYGAAMMRSGLAWAEQNGATIAALNVAADNAGGQALYRALGYERQYDYHYRRPPEGRA